MASSTGDMKGFYRQRKKSGGGISKAALSKKEKAKESSSPKHAASYSSDVVQPPALISHGYIDLQDDYDGNEELLRQFDMNMAYGPCIGMSRLARWERASSLGLNPPKQVATLLKSSSVNKVHSESLWDGRV